MKTKMAAGSWFLRAAPSALCAIMALTVGDPASGAETIYVSNMAGSIEMYDASTGAHLGVIASGLNLPSGLAFDRAGNLYVAISGDNIIERFTTNGVGSVFATGLSYPQGLAFDSAGNLYVANYWDASIVEFTPGGVGSVFATNVSPYGLAFDAAGNLYAADNHASQIMKFTPEGAGSLLAAASFPRGLAFDNRGDLYVAVYGANRIMKLTPDGLSSGFVTNEFGPWWLACDSAGCLYVSYDDGHGTIKKFGPDGTDLGVFASGTSGPGGIAVWPIPLRAVCSSNIIVTATSPSGATTFYTCSTVGGCSGASISCSPPSGSTFPIGATTVSCVATDACGQTAYCAFTVTVVEQTQFTCRTNNGTLTITGYTGPGGDVIIPATIDSLPVIAIGDFAFSSCASLTGVTIPGSVTNIGWAPFSFCTNLTGITVDPANTHYRDLAGVLCSNDRRTLVEYPCGKPGEYIIPAGVTSIGDYAFNRCINITSLVIPTVLPTSGIWRSRPAPR